MKQNRTQISPKHNNIAVCFQNVFKEYNKNHNNVNILNNLSFSIPKGKITSILGPSGSGKTTTAKIINGLDMYNKGKIFINGHLINNRSINNFRKQTAFVFQNFNLFPHMTVLDNIVYSPIKIYKQNKQTVYTKAIKLLQQFNLATKIDCLPGELSGGQQQRVAIIRALMLEPSILIMDEPTASLDPELKHDVTNIIKKINKSGITVICITHDISVAKEISDYILMLRSGKCVDQKPSNVFFDLKKNNNIFSKKFLQKCG